MKYMKSTVVAMAGLVLATATSRAALTDVETVNNGEASLLTIMNNQYGAGNFARVDDTSDIQWTTGGSGAASFIAIYSGAAQTLSTTDLGSLTPSGNPAPIFSVPASTINSTVVPPVTVFTPANSPFLFLDKPTGSVSAYSSSDPSLNTPIIDPATGLAVLDRMVTFLLTGAAYAATPTYVIAFEDGNDFDYNDLVVQVSGVAPVPESTTIVAGALLLLPFGAGALRGFRKNRIA